MATLIGRLFLLGAGAGMLAASVNNVLRLARATPPPKELRHERDVHLDEILERARARKACYRPTPRRRRTKGRPGQWCCSPLGAWLAALPMLGVVGMLLGDLIGHASGPIWLAPCCWPAPSWCCARAICRSSSNNSPCRLLVGGGSLGFGLFRDAGTAGGALLLGLVALGVAAALRAACARAARRRCGLLLAVALTPQRWHSGSARARKPGGCRGTCCSRPG